MNQWERLAIFFWYICCAASMSWSSEYPLLFILETETQYPLNSLIVLLNLDQWTLSWLVTLLRSGMFLLYSSVICFQNESPFLSFPWIGSLDMFSQAFALKKKEMVIKTMICDYHLKKKYAMWLPVQLPHYVTNIFSSLYYLPRHYHHLQCQCSHLESCLYY